MPGVGKVLAERIVAHRPFRSVGELQKVRGIGAKTMFDKLKPHFGVAVVAKQPEPPATKPE